MKKRVWIKAWWRHENCSKRWKGSLRLSRVGGASRNVADVASFSIFREKAALAFFGLWELPRRMNGGNIDPFVLNAKGLRLGRKRQNLVQKQVFWPLGSIGQLGLWWKKRPFDGLQGHNGDGKYGGRVNRWMNAFSNYHWSRLWKCGRKAISFSMM